MAADQTARGEAPGDARLAGQAAAEAASPTSAPKAPKAERPITVIIALAANALIAVAKTWAAVLTGSASMVAEAAHSWADTGNEVFLLQAERSARRPPDDAHPLGYGRSAYVWSMFAAFGLFTVGAVVSIARGVEELVDPRAAEEMDPLWAYLVLALSFALEGISFAQALRETRRGASAVGLRPLRFVSRTSNPTLRAVFAEDAAALIGIGFAAGGIALHQLTGSAVWDGVGSILVGVLLAFVALYLIRRNSEFLTGAPGSPRARNEVLASLLEHRNIARVSFLHLEYVGPERIFVVGAVDVTGNRPEDELAPLLQRVEDDLEREPHVARCLLSLSKPGDATQLRPDATLERRAGG